MKVALDTNVLAYAEDTNSAAEKDAALQLIAALPLSSIVLPVQVLGGLFNVLVLKARRSPTAARGAVMSWCDTFAVADTSPAVMVSAFDLAADHKLRIWDAVILATAAESGCRLLLSEDLQEGFTWRGVTVTNPFAATRHALLDGLTGIDLESPDSERPSKD